MNERNRRRGGVLPTRREPKPTGVAMRRGARRPGGSPCDQWVLAGRSHTFSCRAHEDSWTGMACSRGADESTLRALPGGSSVRGQKSLNHPGSEPRARGTMTDCGLDLDQVFTSGGCDSGACSGRTVGRPRDAFHSLRGLKERHPTPYGPCRPLIPLEPIYRAGLRTR